MKKLILLGSLMFMALAAKAQASGAVTLGWTLSVSTSVTNQTLWYGPATGSYTNSLQLGPAVSQFQVTNLVQGGVYYFTVTCTANGQTSVKSNEIQVVVPPAPPTGLHLISVP